MGLSWNPWFVHERFIERCGSVSGAATGEGAFAPGPAIWVGKREVAHIDADGAVDIRLTRLEIRARRAELRADHRITFRASGSDWLEFRIGSDADLDDAVALATAAIAANLPTSPDGLPPTGAELERRRRFH
jgi:Family of unknown function (DUF5519)